MLIPSTWPHPLLKASRIKVETIDDLKVIQLWAANQQEVSANRQSTEGHSSRNQSITLYKYAAT